MAEIVKLQAKQTVNNTLYYCNRPNITLVYNLLLNSEVLIWRKSSNQTRPYRLLAVEDKICYIQLFSRLISFKSIFIKFYFWSKNTYNIKLDKLKVTTELDKIEIFLFTLKAPQKSTKPTKPAVKWG